MKSVVYLGCPSAERPETEKTLVAAGLSVVWADSVSGVVDELERRQVPVLLDLSRGAAALQHAREIRNQRASALLFAVVDPRRPDLTTEAILVGMADVFARPLGGRRVVNAIDRELAYDAHPPQPRPDSRGDDLYSYSSQMRSVMTLIEQAAAMRAGVMIRGEDGTGRQVVARTIHGFQAQPAGPFITVNCAEFDADQLDADLFGVSVRAANGDDHGLERMSRKSVLFEAIGGTLYFQNLADAPTRVQGRLARALRDREVVLAESGQTVALDVRPMTGAPPGIERMVSEGRVRDDLFRRLSIVAIDMPPLRDRQEDIPALANYFVRDTCARQRVPPKTLSRPALSLIAALPWRGNAVELRTLLENIVTSLGVGRGIGLEDVLAHVRLDGGSRAVPGGGTLRQARACFEREYIAAVLDQHRGRISEAAKALGIQRTNLYRKMRTLRVAPVRRHESVMKPGSEPAPRLKSDTPD